MIATSHREENVAASSLYCSLGFLAWEPERLEDPGEVYLKLPESST